MGEIRVAVAGVGNCCSALLQGIEYYRTNGSKLGLLHRSIGGYDISDLRIVTAFDIDASKIGKDISEAIFAEPNKAPRFVEVAKKGIEVLMGPAPDSLDKGSMSHITKADDAPVEIVETLTDAKVDILVNLISGGSDKASRVYAESCVKAGCGFLNATPSGVVNDLRLASA